MSNYLTATIDATREADGTELSLEVKCSRDDKNIHFRLVPGGGAGFIVERDAFLSLARSLISALEGSFCAECE